MHCGPRNNKRNSTDSGSGLGLGHPVSCSLRSLEKPSDQEDSCHEENVSSHHHISDRHLPVSWGSVDSVQGFIERGLPNQGCDRHSGVNAHTKDHDPTRSIADVHAGAMAKLQS